MNIAHDSSFGRQLQWMNSASNRLICKLIFTTFSFENIMKVITEEARCLQSWHSNDWSGLVLLQRLVSLYWRVSPHWSPIEHQQLPTQLIRYLKKKFILKLQLSEEWINTINFESTWTSGTGLWLCSSAVSCAWIILTSCYMSIIWMINREL